MIKIIFECDWCGDQQEITDPEAISALLEAERIGEPLRCKWCQNKWFEFSGAPLRNKVNVYREKLIQAYIAKVVAEKRITEGSK